MEKKKRVNITIDGAVHIETKARLDASGMDFSAFIEQACLGFLSATHDMFRRMDVAKAGGPEVSPSELRVLMLQAVGGVQVKTGAEFAKVLSELDVIEARLDAQPKLLPPESIHTPAKKTTAKKTAKK
jgi:hypothetical protein